MEERGAVVPPPKEEEPAASNPHIPILASASNPQIEETPAEMREATSPRATGRVASLTLLHTGPSDPVIQERTEDEEDDEGDQEGRGKARKARSPAKLQIPKPHDHPHEESTPTTPTSSSLSATLLVPSPSSGGSTGSTDVTPPASPHAPVEFKDRFVERRDKIALEILTSERKYVAVLQFVMDEYLLPLKRLAEKKGDVVPLKKIPCMFSKLEELHKINFKLLARLEDAIGRNWSPTQCIAPIFLETAPQLNMYMEYVAHHKTSILTVSKFGKKAQFVNFCEAVKAKKEGNMEARRLDLLGLLIQPVQRIPRYQMLLEDLRRRSPEDHPDYQNLTLAIAEITRIANEVNAQMDKEENFLKMYKIQASFIGNVKCLVKEGRVFVREGALIKMCRKVPKKRWFFLFNDALVYGSLVGADKAEKASVYTRETAGKTSNRYTFHRMIEFGSGRQGEKNRDTFKVRDIPDSGDEKYAFQIISSEKSFTVYGRSQEEKEAWMVDLQQQLATQGAATGEDEGAPVWIPDNKATDCQMCGIPFTVIRRRHHCRNCGKVVCGSCSSKKARLSKLKTEKAVRVCTFCYNWLHTKEGEGDEESVHGAEGDESSEDKRNSGRDEGAKEESENEDDENNKKKPSATKKPKKEKKERKRDKLGNLLSWRSDDHKRPTSGKSRHGDTKEREGLDFEPVQLPSPSLSSEGPKPHSGDHAPVQASGEAAPVPEGDEASTVQNEEPTQAHHPLAEEQHQHQQREGAEAEHESEKEQEKANEKEKEKDEKEKNEKEKEKDEKEEKEKQSMEMTPPSSTPQPATATASSVLWRRSSITPGRTSPAPLLLNAANSPAATPTTSSLSAPNRSPASPALSRVSNRGQRMSIGLERVKLQAALALEAAQDSNQ